MSPGVLSNEDQDLETIPNMSKLVAMATEERYSAWYLIRLMVNRGSLPMG